MNRPRRAPTAPPPPTARALAVPLVAVTVAAVVLLAVVAVVVTRGGDGDGPTAPEQVEVAPVAVAGTPLPRLGSGADPAVGQVAPTLRGVGFDGSPVDVAPDGRPRMVVFLAHWCPHCQDEVPVVTDWLEKNGDPDGVQLLSVSTGVASNQPNYPPSRWLEREGWKVPVLVDDADSTTSKVFGLSGFPFFVATDAQGRVVARADGAQPVAQLEAMIAAARG